MSTPRGPDRDDRGGSPRDPRESRDPRDSRDGGDLAATRDTPPVGLPVVGAGAGADPEGAAQGAVAGAEPALPPEGGAGTMDAAASPGDLPPGDDPGGEGEPDGAAPSRSGRRAGRARHVARGRRRRRRRLIALGVVVLVALLGGFVAWVEVEAHPSGGPGAAVVVSVREGEPTGTVLAQLAHRGVLGNVLAFRVWSVVHGTPTVLPGKYLFHRNLPFSTVQRLLAAGPNVVRLDVLAGMTLAEIEAQLSSLPNHLAQTFAAEARKGAVASPYEEAPGGSLEGLVGTGVYEIMPGERAHQLLAQMVARFDAEARSAGLKPSSTVEGLNAYQVVTAASIAQKEGYFHRYFGKVARVVYNRLAKGMKLEMTSTVLYSLGQDGGPVTPAEEQITTPYNTYLHAGLTPTPICTPSAAALAATVSPPTGPWLYFDLVTAKKGIMVFSATFTGQRAAEQRKARMQATGTRATGTHATGTQATAQQGTGTP